MAPSSSSSSSSTRRRGPVTRGQSESEGPARRSARNSGASRSTGSAGRRNRSRSKSQRGGSRSASKVPEASPLLLLTRLNTEEIRSEHGNKLRSFRVRLYSALVLMVSFAAIIYAGHVPLMGLIFSIQTVMVKELFQLAREAQQERKLPGFRAQQWYFYFVAAFWVYVRFVKNNLIVEMSGSVMLVRLLGTLVRRHTMVSYTLYACGFGWFVLGLEKGSYTYQFGQFAWTHMILMTVFLPSSFFVSNIFEGIIWFLLPTSLVIVNDIAAYLAGFFFGRTPLIKLSPKKTWEGFIGGFFGTILASWYLSGWMSKSSWLTCPRHDLSIWQPMECTEPPETFQPREFAPIDVVSLFAEPKFIQRVQYVESKLPESVQRRIHEITIHAAPMQFHAVALALFASAIAPFGGFFASGFKRGFNIKDFGSSIPGHGGMTDRMDCQIVMALFSYIYYHAFTDRSMVTLASVMSMVLKLRPVDQLDLLLRVANMLQAIGFLPVEIVESIAAVRRNHGGGDGGDHQSMEALLLETPGQA